MSDQGLIDVYLYNAGLSAMERYLQQHPAHTISTETKLWILEQIRQYEPRGSDSSKYKKAKLLLKL